MHSSRTRAACLLTYPGGVGLPIQVGLHPGGVCPTRGDLHPWGFAWGVCLGWGSASKGSTQLGVGGSAQPLGLPMGGRWADPLPLWTEGTTHACKNITLPKLRLRAVINKKAMRGFLHSCLSFQRQKEKVIGCVVCYFFE